MWMAAWLDRMTVEGSSKRLRQQHLQAFHSGFDPACVAALEYLDPAEKTGPADRDSVFNTAVTTQELKLLLTIKCDGRNRQRLISHRTEPEYFFKRIVTIQILFWSTRFSVSNNLKFSGGHKIVVRLSCRYQFENSVN